MNPVDALVAHHAEVQKMRAELGRLKQLVADPKGVRARVRLLEDAIQKALEELDPGFATPKHVIHMLASALEAR